MFENLIKQPPDNIMALMGMFSKDSRADKMDLGVGVYRDKTGKTPIIKAVKIAEKQLFDDQLSKSYVGLLGAAGFIDRIIDLTLKDSISLSRVVGAQAPGGTGALHQLFLLIRATRSNPTVWISKPTWPNHPAILNHLGLKIKNYNYFDETTCALNFDAMKEDLEGAQTGDVLLLHGCCHNPTGANLSLEEWSDITDLCLKKNITPLIDIAYQGFGDGLDADALGVRLMASKVPNMMIAVSCSKNFGVYRDRVGAALVVSEKKSIASLVQDNLKSLNRLTFSFPPDHGAAVVELILKDNSLKKKWKNELDEMRTSMLNLRLALSDALRKATKSSRFDFIASHRGMFSRLGLSEKNVKVLRQDFGIYMVADSRINIAGLQLDKIKFLATSISKTL